MEQFTETIQEVDAALKVIREKRRHIIQIAKQYEEYEKRINKTADELNANLGDFIDKEAFLELCKKPYAIHPAGKNTILVFVPKCFKNFQVGWLKRETDTFYVYELNQYSAWLSDVPEKLLQEIEFPEPINATIEGNQINFNPADKEQVKKKLGHRLADFTENTARIKKGHEFDIIADLVESGRKPYRPRPVAQADLRPPSTIVDGAERHQAIRLRDYQKPAWNKFLSTGAIGLFFPTGAGKSFLAMNAIDRLVGKKLIVVPGLTLADQWSYYIDKYIPSRKHEVTITTYQGYRYNPEDKFVLGIYDECHRLPANTFSKLATINVKYRMGLSASPHREDGREKLIFALTGEPVGLNWPKYMETTGRKYHQVNVHIVKHQYLKLAKINHLLNISKKTFIFCDSLDFGNTIASKFRVPFIHGETKNRLDEINNNKVVVISRVGDMGVSVDDLERIIEADFQQGSRMQELQRTGRLMHSNSKSLKHDIIMTIDEMRDHNKRLWALREKGFNVRVLE